jgi:hypothetical protein
MGEDRKSKNRHAAEEIIAAFDRERAEANDLQRRHAEQVRSSRANDRLVHTERQRGHSH